MAATDSIRLAHNFKAPTGTTVRDIDDLIKSAQDVIHRGCVHAGNWNITPLFSGGHDSLCATHLASQHPRFAGRVYHIDTGIGSAYTRRFVESVASQYGWNLVVLKSRETYERIISEHGFPGPGGHNYVYNRLKDRCVRTIVKGRSKTILLSGCRSAESVRRMGHVEPVKVGYRVKKGKNAGKLREKNRIWTAPCHDWSKAEQAHYMDEMGLPVNKLKVAIGMSGECFCGAFAAEGERELIKEHSPDVDIEIERLTVIARDCGKPCIWGVRPHTIIRVAETGPMCSSCDQRAASIGIQVVAEHG